MIETNINLGNLILTVESNNELTTDVIQEIQNLKLDIYFNNDTTTHWSFDIKLSCGYWLENITYNNELTLGSALINN